MDKLLSIAVLASLVVVATILGFWRLSESKRAIRDRLGYRVRATEKNAGIFRAGPQKTTSRWWALASQTGLLRWLTTLTEQAGYDNARTSVVLFLTGTCALVGATAGWYLTGGIVMGVLSALIVGSLPYFYLLHKRHRRLRDFEQLFPDSLDMMTRSIRAGHALIGAIQLVGEQMPDPIGQEFRRVFEEIRLGLDPGEALSGIQRRVPTEDTGFFCTAISIQRIGGGNMAEILERLSEVIRERFKVLKQARVLSAQHKWSAIIVGLSPIIFAFIFELTNPGYFNPLFKSPYAPYLLTAGLAFEVIGFLSIWRIAKINV